MTKKKTHQKDEVRKIANELLPKLKKDKNWGVATDQGYCNDAKLWKRSVARLTKKAVKLLYPNYKVSVRRGRGTAHNWVHVDLAIPELISKGTADWKVKYEKCVRIRSRVKSILLALKISYACYYSDCGPGGDSPSPCLGISINGSH